MALTGIGHSDESATLKTKAVSPEVAATLVIFNNADSVSVALAGYYADKRGIPYDHLIGLDCPLAEEISRKDYDTTIATPLRKILMARDWWKVTGTGTEERVEETKIHFVVLMRGMPLKIAPVPVDPSPHPQVSVIKAKNEASVDSELASLGYFRKNLGGPQGNPYYRSYTPILSLGDKLPGLLLVCRLDAADAPTVRRMIDDAIDTEKNGLFGFSYIDTRGIMEGPFSEGDKWLRNIAKNQQRAGIPVVMETTPALFPDAYPMGHAAYYYGWYNSDVIGPFGREDFRFVKGAVACHIHSYSASTIRDPRRCWVAPLLARGAAATMGNVYEPFLSLTPQLDVFDDRLRAGFTFAESAYMCERVTDWMTTFVGDPLYRPFKPEDGSGTTTVSQNPEWQAYREGALLWFSQGRDAGEKNLMNSGMKLHSGMIFESLGLLQGTASDYAAAFQSFQQARKFYTDTGDIIRTLIHQIWYLKATGNTKDALTLVRRGIKVYPAAPATAVLRAYEAEMAPPPTPAPSPNSSASPQPPSKARFQNAKQ